MIETTWQIIVAGDPNSIQKVRWFAKSQRGNLGGVAIGEEQLYNVNRLSSIHDYDTYVTLNPTTQRPCKRIRAEDVTHWSFILLDLDPLNPVSENLAVQTAEQLRQDLANTFHPEFRKSAIIYTGRGVQIWVRLTPFWVGTEKQLITETTRRLIAAVTALVPEGWRLDNLADLSRIARMPGSVNQKTKRVGSLIDSGRIASPELTDWIFACHKPTHTPPVLPTPEVYDREWEDIKPDLTLRSKRFLDLGADEGERHESCFQLVKNLHEHGVSKASAYAALKWADDASRPSLRISHGHKALLEILHQVYGRE